jgi:hypothetical protein
MMSVMSFAEMATNQQQSNSAKQVDAILVRFETIWDQISMKKVLEADG